MWSPGSDTNTNNDVHLEIRFYFSSVSTRAIVCQYTQQSKYTIVEYSVGVPNFKMLLCVSMRQENMQKVKAVNISQGYAYIHVL